MLKVASFSINHNLLTPGLYLSRRDGDISTYDLRFKRPNAGDYLANGALHTLEHLMATFVRNSQLAGHVVYFGPMGCRTGFYLLMRGVSDDEAVALVRDAVDSVCRYEGQIPGSLPEECGNYREHDLAGAIREARAYYEYIRSYSPGQLSYPCI